MRLLRFVLQQEQESPEPRQLRELRAPQRISRTKLPSLLNASACIQTQCPNWQLRGRDLASPYSIAKTQTVFRPFGTLRVSPSNRSWRSPHEREPSRTSVFGARLRLSSACRDFECSRSSPIPSSTSGRQPTGIEHDILDYFAKSRTRRCRSSGWTRSRECSSASKGEVDPRPAFLTITPDRTRRMDFTASYFPVQVILVSG
jgi:hypothetical protein